MFVSISSVAEKLKGIKILDQDIRAFHLSDQSVWLEEVN